MIVHPDLWKQSDVHCVIRMVVGEDHVRHVGGSDPELLERIEDGPSMRHHPRVDDGDDVGVADETDRAGNAGSCVSGEQNVE